MRLFVSNGVTKGQLDGSHVDLSGDDYYSITTSGSKDKENSDYALAHKITKAKFEDKSPEDEEYPYYNGIPYYTYPNSWESSMLETTQTTLTIVVPWEKKESGKTTDVSGKIVTRKYLKDISRCWSPEHNCYYCKGKRWNSFPFIIFNTTIGFAFM